MLDLSTVINISVSQAPTGLGIFNVNNVLLLTSDAFLANPNSDTYRAYTSAQAVGTDFGTTTETYQQAQAFFAQQPNVLNGGGVLYVAPFIVGDSSNIATAVARLKPSIYFCGIISTSYPVSGSMKTLADAIQVYGDKILILPSTTYSDVAGAFTDIKTAGDYNTRCLFYSVTTGSSLQCRLFAAAYAGAMFSTNFNASNSTLTANLKQLATITPDPGITTAYLTALATAGVDCYTSVAGISALLSQGANKYFDSVYNLIWFVNSLKVAGFNALLQVGSKVPQTEPGVALLKNAYRNICLQAVNNGYLAPGAWTSDTFGNQVDFLANIVSYGYYLYSQPVNQQATSARAARQCPVIQIAGKEAGAIHSSSVTVNINP